VLPESTKLTGGFTLGLIDEDGVVVATKARTFDAYTQAEIEYTFALKAKELARDFIAIWLAEQSNT